MSELQISPIKRITALFFTSGVGCLSLFPLQLILPQLSEYFHISYNTASWFTAAGILAIALFTIPCTVIANAFPLKKAVLFCFVLSGILSFLTGIVDGFWPVLIMRFITSILVSCVINLGSTLHSYGYHSQKDLTRVAGIFVGGLMFGSVLGRIIAAAIATHFPWEYGMYAIGIIYFITAPLIAAWSPNPPFSHKKGHLLQEVTTSFSIGFRQVLDPHLLAAFLSSFLVLMMIFANLSALELYLLKPPFSLNSEHISFLLAAYIVPCVILNRSGELLKRFNHLLIKCITCILVFLSLSLLLIPTLLAIVIGFTVLSTCILFIYTVCIGYIQNYVTNLSERAVAFSVLTSFYFFGGCAGLLYGSWLVHLDWRHSIMGQDLIVLFMLITLLWLYFTRPNQQPSTSSQP